jgi:hypothetical protein
MEKSELALWSTPQLREAVQRDGVLCVFAGSVERCRRVFVRMVRMVLAEFVFYT